MAAGDHYPDPDMRNTHMIMNEIGRLRYDIQRLAHLVEHQMREYSPPDPRISRIREDEFQRIWGRSPIFDQLQTETGWDKDGNS